MYLDLVTNMPVRSLYKNSLEILFNVWPLVKILLFKYENRNRIVLGMKFLYLMK